MTLRQLLGITDLLSYITVRQNDDKIWGNGLAVNLLIAIDNGEVSFGDQEVAFLSVEDHETLYIVLEDVVS
jgi:hypothetical protein